MPLLQPTLILACLLPFGWLVWRVLNNDLGANPVETLTHETGLWALRLLLLTLTITPLRRLLAALFDVRWGWLVRTRRTLGLSSFGYGLLHFGIYLGLDRALDWSTIAEDVLNRPYLTVGFAALVLMIPLAVTSTRGWVRRLGRRWQQLHRMVYIIGILAVVHFLWLVKADLREPGLYAGLLALLLLARLPVPAQRWGRRRTTAKAIEH